MKTVVFFTGKPPDIYWCILKANLSWTWNKSISSVAKNFRQWFYFL